MWVFPRPLEHSEPWRRREEEGLPCPVEVLRHHDRGGHQGPEDVVLDVRDAEQGGAVSAGPTQPDSQLSHCFLCNINKCHKKGCAESIYVQYTCTV